MSNIEGNLGKFCEFCTEISRILGSNHPEAIDVPHHKTYKAFLESAEGCPLCSLVIQGLRKYRDGIVGIKCSCSRELRVQVKYSQGLQSNAFAAPLEDNFYFDLFRDRNQAVMVAHEVFGRPILEDPAAEAVVSVALPWISDFEDENLPTRVLDVGKDGNDVVLRESKDLSGNYTVLRHCWGTERTLTTTVATISHHMDKISYKNLPATFLDAVRITRLLGVRYLWIDSLCII
ncbi:hypothetical protein DL95DRAFT_410052 [Leptodontidium sp. 2 PMI_412]|nr:hypothetical protein DL95DRAFT_410052 [Leptodontidium sp. 2 PMI_412]